MKQDVVVEIHLSEERIPGGPSMATKLHLIDVLLKMALTQQHPIPNTKALLKSQMVEVNIT